MSHIDIEVKRIKEKLLEMWDLVDYQFQSGQEAMATIDHELAKRVIKLGRKVNNYDVKIDRMSENVLALFTPVAIDLRLMLATLKINASLERIGDDSEGIAYFVQKLSAPLNPELVEETRVIEMYEAAKAMLADCRTAFMKDDTELAKELIKRDKTLNKIYAKADTIIARCLTEDISKIGEGLVLFSIIKKIERVGDQITNIAEEIVFYRDAKVIRHKRKKKKKE
ncbi:phosphate signaling complex protein PhoU [Pontibacter beigongshangensis]|uniref:phosphate signaling complex protein PhoU n=1 Tax=Pontibacter beigongshangensis TaxID=2574733 RepID=UPI00165049AA|nr:phosphate signaling complex protein PhoU [Pontibacter beigongshangensis]